MIAPHGIPVDLLDRLVIVRTMPYSVEECVQILQIRARVEGISVDAASLASLGGIAERTSLRHAVQLLTPASIIAKTNGRDGLVEKDVEDAAMLFLDAKASARILAENAAGYITV